MLQRRPQTARQYEHLSHIKQKHHRTHPAVRTPRKRSSYAGTAQMARPDATRSLIHNELPTLKPTRLTTPITYPPSTQKNGVW